MGHSETHIHFFLLLWPGTSTGTILRTFPFGPPHLEKPELWVQITALSLDSFVTSEKLLNLFKPVSSSEN